MLIQNVTVAGEPQTSEAHALADAAAETEKEREILEVHTRYLFFQNKLFW